MEQVSGTYEGEGPNCTAGIALVADINPGSSGSYPIYLTAVGDTLYFVADDGVHGQELWWSNGTAATTAKVSIRSKRKPNRSAAN